MTQKIVFFLYIIFVLILFTACSQQNARPTPTLLPLPSVEIIELAVTATPLPSPTRTPKPSATRTPAATPTPFITPPPAGESVAIPILMYHHLKYREPNASQVLLTWTVAPDQFAAQLDYLQERGFHTITFRQLVAFFDDGAPLPLNPILLTFDDGWIDAYTVAFPELQERGMVGNFFVPTRYADAGGEQVMNWEQIIEMDRAGMEFGGHTINHADLTQVNLDVMQRELRGAKQKMEEKLGHPTYAFSYPFGAFNPRVVAQTEAAGYRAAVILCCGYKLTTDTMLVLPRIRISYDDSLEDIEKKLP